MPGKLEIQVKFLRANPEVAAVFAMPRFIDQRGAPLADSFNGDVFQAPFAKNLRTRPDWLRHFFYEGNCLCHPASMVRRAVYDRIGLFDRRFANLLDFDMWVRMCMEHEIRVIPARADRDANPRRQPQHECAAPRHQSAVADGVFSHSQALPRPAARHDRASLRPGDSESAKLDAEGVRWMWCSASWHCSAWNPLHKLFALNSMFDAMRDAGNPSRLIELTGAIDVFAIETVRASPRLLEQVAEARAEAARLSSDAAQAAATANALRAEVLQVREEAAQAQADAARTIELKQRLADRLHAALRATYAESARLDDQLGTEQANRARMTSALQAIQDHVSTITTRSRAYRLLRLLTGLRRKIEMIAGEASRALDPDGG